MRKIINKIVRFFFVKFFLNNEIKNYDYDYLYKLYDEQARKVAKKIILTTKKRFFFIEEIENLEYDLYILLNEIVRDSKFKPEILNPGKIFNLTQDIYKILRSYDCGDLILNCRYVLFNRNKK